ncbi:hypothetical protein GCM10010503_12020 [Streptomyces lucensis JCM 4490]|uniref:Uncharacterized protein n=1 Tax=Streptomyces lucensis JCM 4490 TaxID=1306176 RepID=A0A918IY42_9ACTN|nr:hypothetical protein [Streptomyces lucensis]GGW37602.1 hypothetical protein GCM10010503_12020 [Streptomyces lucensis JCM 4490]
MDRWDRAGRVAAYGAALALTPYLLIKVSWVVGSLLGLLPVGTGFGKAGWVVLNSATIGMAGIGIAVALALVQPWGMRIPGAPLAFCAWVGTGFLVPVLPYAVVSSLLGSADGDPKSGSDAGPSMPGWEAALVQTGFVGMGLGLAIALPAYMRRRWPGAFVGRLGDGGECSPRALPWMTVVGASVGLVWLYWAAGGTAGVAHRGERDLAWYALSGVFGLWAFVASLATLAAVRGRPARVPRWGPVVFGWLGSGSLFAWSGWKLPFTLYLMVAQPADAALPEDLALAACLHLAAVGAGAAMLRTLVRTGRPGRAAVPSPTAPCV